MKLFCWRTVFDICHTFRNKLILYKIKRTSFPKFSISVSVTNVPILIKFVDAIVKLKIKRFLLMVFFSYGPYFSSTIYLNIWKLKICYILIEKEPIEIEKISRSECKIRKENNFVEDFVSIYLRLFWVNELFLRWNFG